MSKEDINVPDDKLAIANQETGEVAIGEYGKREEIGELGYRIKSMLPGGKKLTNPEAIALAQYGIASELDPMKYECYYVPGSGPVPGIAGYRRKADEQLEYEVDHARAQVAPRWFTKFSPVEPGVEAEYDPEQGDIAYRCTITDSLTKFEWEQRRLSTYIELMKAGDEDAWDHSIGIVGPLPSWSAVGVVFGREKFKGDKPTAVEYMDRHERAQKRAEKPAIKKRFPRIRIEGPPVLLTENGYSYDDAIDVEVSEVPTDLLPAEVKAEPDKIIEELGYDTPKTEHVPANAEHADDHAGHMTTVEKTIKPYPKKAKKVTEPLPAKDPNPRPYPPSVVRKRLADRAAQFTPFKPTEPQQKALRMALLNVFEGDKEAESKRHALLAYLSGSGSTKDTGGPLFKAIYEDWLKVKEKDGLYYNDPLAVQEAQSIVTEALKEEGQQDLL